MQIFLQILAEYLDINESGVATVIICYILILGAIWGLIRVAAFLINKFIVEHFSKDKIERVNIFVNDVYFPVSYWTEKGGRPYQEDRHSELKGIGCKDSSLYAIFDGHGGSGASEYCKEHLLKYVIQDPNYNKHIPTALYNSFCKVDDEFTSIARIRYLNDGTTAVVAVIHNNVIYVANAGDSRGIIAQKGGKAKGMSVDHKPDREDEEKRIKALGGRVLHWGRWRVEGILAVSRAIGDIALQPYVTAEPEIMEKTIGSEDEYLILASDGVWDVMSNEDVARFVVTALSNSTNVDGDFINIARHLCAEAMLLGSTDNVTALVIDLKNRVSTKYDYLANDNNVNNRNKKRR